METKLFSQNVTTRKDLGLQRKLTYEDLVRYINKDPDTISYPNRKAKIIRNSFVLSQLDGIGQLEIDRQHHAEQMRLERRLLMLQFATDNDLPLGEVQTYLGNVGLYPMRRAAVEDMLGHSESDEERGAPTAPPVAAMDVPAANPTEPLQPTGAMAAQGSGGQMGPPQPPPAPPPATLPNLGGVAILPPPPLPRPRRAASREPSASASSSSWHGGQYPHPRATSASQPASLRVYHPTRVAEMIRAGIARRPDAMGQPEPEPGNPRFQAPNARAIAGAVAGGVVSGANMLLHGAGAMAMGIQRVAEVAVPMAGAAAGVASTAGAVGFGALDMAAAAGVGTIQAGAAASSVVIPAVGAAAGVAGPFALRAGRAMFRRALRSQAEFNEIGRNAAQQLVFVGGEVLQHLRPVQADIRAPDVAAMEQAELMAIADAMEEEAHQRQQRLMIADQARDDLDAAIRPRWWARAESEPPLAIAPEPEAADEPLAPAPAALRPFVANPIPTQRARGKASLRQDGTPYPPTHHLGG